MSGRVYGVSLKNTRRSISKEFDVKLSVAIRVGSKMKPQSPWDKAHVGSSCALGAAADAVGVTITDGGDDALLKTFPQLSDAVDAFEEIGAGTLRNTICRLNNAGRTREQIADIVQGMGY